jgi:tetratricopeptide (TPR) repeat protein
MISACSLRKRNHHSSSPLWAGLLLLQIFLSLSSARAQHAPGSLPSGETASDELQMREIEKAYCDRETLQLTVRTEKNALLDRQAVAKLHEQKKDVTLWQSTSKESEATFCVDFGDYDVEVSAVGSLTGHKEVAVHVGGSKILKVEIILQTDPSAVELSASDDAIPPKMRKDVKRAVDELKAGNFTKAHKQLDKVYPAVPSSAQLNFLYGYLFLQLKDMEKSGAYLKRAVALNSRNVQALILLGREQLHQGETEEARKTLEQAVIANSADWMAHNLLADAYLQQKKFEEARQQAQIAIEAGKGSASAAQLALGLALASLGRIREGIAALNSFLQTHADNPTVPQVKKLIAQIEARDAGNAAPAGEEPVSDLVLASSIASLPPSAWGPPGVDEIKPLVAPGVSCPAKQVLEMAGERVRELVDSMSQFSAIEDLLHEQLDRSGNPLTKETRKYDYVASITEDLPGFLAVDEYRNNRGALPNFPDHISTQGFMAAALIFHPDMQENFDLTCEGLGQWHGNATWLVHFRQRDDKPKQLEDYIEQDQTYGVSQKGRAWINSDNFQIVRVESELVNSVQRLTVQHQIAEYGPVKFQKKNVQLWLPQNVDLFLEINRHRYYRRHSFDHYMLFSVNAEQKSGAVRGAQRKEPQSQ